MDATLFGALRRPNRLQARSEFYRAWAAALQAKNDLGQSIASMEHASTAELLAARNSLRKGVSKGRPIGVVSRMQPNLFPAIDEALLTAGERFGTLPDSLRLLAEFYTRDFARMARIRRWAGFPILLAIAAAIVLPLPLLWDANRWAYAVAVIGGVVGVYALGGIPVALLYSVAQETSRIRRSRFACALAVGLEGGLTLAAAARLAGVVGDMPTVVTHLDAIPPRTLASMSLSRMLEGSGIWPAMQVQVAKADEASEYLGTLRVFAEQLESPP